MVSAAGSAAWSCRLALALALDVSSSVDVQEYGLQRNGLAAALIDPDVVRALLVDPSAPVTIAVFEFSGSRQQYLIADWQELRSPNDVLDLAETIVQSRRSETDYPTAIGYALGYAAGLFKRAPDCLFKKLDVSGDGKNNFGFAPELAFKHFPLREVTVNGLVVGGEVELESLVSYYQSEIIRGPGAFVIVAEDYNGFLDAMKRKLLREVETQIIGALEAPEQIAPIRHQ